MSAQDDDVTIDPELTRAALGVTSAITQGPADRLRQGSGGQEAGHYDNTSFAPGAIIASRYRLVALLGRGGMGEVYRADDLTLDQPVALKFLPAAVADGDTRLGQFHNELRVARQVSHKNVCRLYDLGEANGRRFLTMEYVDGEDLGSLLRRIGRIPHDKAVQIARQLCAGVAAAHDCGVLHRDLKPANVMIDGDGNVRITDFGIATAAGGTLSRANSSEQGESGDANEFAGTLQYMAPEQFAGKGASIKTDIYALGLTLFEVFTGRRAQESKTLDDLRKFHQTGTHTTPSSIVRDLDPAVERLILRCLDRDPDRRPASALVVAAALPGADPLAAALAAGETPSPEILAAAGEAEALGVARGVSAVVAIAAGLLAFAMLSPHLSIVGRVPIDKPPAVLIDKANDLVAALGYAEPIGDQASRFAFAEGYVEWLRGTRPNPQRWEPLSVGTPSGVNFWYRTSPQELRKLASGAVTATDPPLRETGQRLIVLDGMGRLVEFRSVPNQFEKAPVESSSPPSWSTLFAAAGLEMSAFSPVAPQWTPRDYADMRAAWEGSLPGRSDISLRVEGGSYRGKPVSFLVAGPWTRPTLMVAPRRSTIDTVAAWIVVSILAVLLGAAVLLARRNIASNRADRHGALRVAVFIGCGAVLGWIVDAHHISRVDVEFGAFLDAVGDAAAGGMGVWLIYVALEPYVRRFWPDSLLGWSRLIAGHIRDPRVGRDVLVGGVFGVALGVVEITKLTLVPRLGYVAQRPAIATRLEALSGLGPMLSVWNEQILNAVVIALLDVLMVVVLRLALKRNWLVMPLSVVLLSTSLNYLGGSGPVALVFPLLGGVLVTLVTVRYGLLSLVVARVVWNLIYTVPMMPVISHWSAAAGNWTIALLMVLTLWAFYASRAGQPLCGSLLKE